MKKAAALLLALVLVLALAACGAKVDPNTLPGKTEGQVYTNDILKLKCTIPVGWVIADQDQLDDYNDLTEAEKASTDYGAKLKAHDDTLADLFVYTPAGNFFTVSIVGGATVNNSMSAQKLIENLKEDDLKALSDSGLTDVQGDAAAYTFMGEQTYGLKAQAKDEDGQEVQFAEIYVKGSGEYGAFVNVYGSDEAAVSEILSCFSKYEPAAK